MVFSTKLLFSKKRAYSGVFVDSLKLFVKGGSGGNGYPKFGGIGGTGGNIIFKAEDGFRLETLYRKYKNRHIIAEHGRHSSHNFIIGQPGNNCEIRMPTGVTIYSDIGKIGELNTEDEEIVIARGGTGGHRKNGYLGVQGELKNIFVELKLIADIGLVGFPNAGKSTLLKAISKAKPKIANYPFTTITPNVGIIEYKDLRQISMADLPGLIEGAHSNQGMGHRFLRHVERTKLLLLVVDINGFQLSPRHEYRDCLETIIILNKELELYNEELLKKPAMLIVNKMDTEGASQKYEVLEQALQNFKTKVMKSPEKMRPERALEFSDILSISANDEENIDLVKERLRKCLDRHYDLKEVDCGSVIRSIESEVKEHGPTLI